MYVNTQFRNQSSGVDAGMSGRDSEVQHRCESQPLTPTGCGIRGRPAVALVSFQGVTLSKGGSIFDRHPGPGPTGGEAIRPETAARLEVGAWDGPGMLENCIAVRLRDPLGRPLGYAGRRLTPGNRGKWVFPPALPKSQLLYQYHRLPDRLDRALVLVEGPWDVLRLTQSGFPAVALFGVHLSDCQEALLRSVPRLLVMLDGDPAGRQGAERICRLLKARPITIGDGLDPDDLSDQELSEIVAESLPS